MKDDFGPTTPERAVWDQRSEKELQIYMALRLDSFYDWSVKHHMEECAQEDTHKSMRFWFERAVDEQKKELRDYKKKLKASHIELVPITIEPMGDVEQSGQSKSTDDLGTIEA